MGAKGVRIPQSQEDLNNFTRYLLKDIQALEKMLEEDWFEKDVIRIGAEQEICLVDEHGKPAPKSMEILKALNHPSYTTELARFNLECNLQPEVLTGKCFSSFEKQLRDLMNNLSEKAARFGVTPILTGI
ncbi:MAG: CBS domain-containing protein, partial [Flammeovirgaceae bacterium]|nr:CBS domain-containing protein [Flammeovirgaceae bacterium]